MSEIIFKNREISSEELKQMNAGFDQNTIDNGVKIQTADRFSFVATIENNFVGCASGLAYKNDDEYSGWFYLTDLFVEKEFRFQKVGSKLLSSLEKEIKKIGVLNTWVWTAGYEASPFYQKQGYKIFAKMENWYSDGSSRVGLRKNLLNQRLP